MRHLIQIFSYMGLISETSNIIDKPNFFVEKSLRLMVIFENLGVEARSYSQVLGKRAVGS